MKVHIESREQTAALAQSLAEKLKGKTVTLCLSGDLGAGKTTFTQFLGRALGVKSVINSPTFTILKSYSQADGTPLWHMDAYRLEGMHQDLGFEECFDQGLCVVEWADYIADQLPEERIEITISSGEGEERFFEIENHSSISLGEGAV